MNDKFQPVLYILMRRDIYDMNPGKAFAQGAHAVSMFHEGMTYILDYGTPEYRDVFDKFFDWKNESTSRCFGTTIVLHSILEEFPVSEEDWKTDGMHFFKLEGSDTKAMMGLVLDDEYPFRNWNGEAFHSPEITACFVFAHNQEIRDYMKKYELHP